MNSLYVLSLPALVTSERLRPSLPPLNDAPPTPQEGYCLFLVTAQKTCYQAYGVCFRGSLLAQSEGCGGGERPPSPASDPRVSDVSFSTRDLAPPLICSQPSLFV